MSLKPHELKKIAESEFEALIQRAFGKQGYVHRLPDTHDVRRMTTDGFRAKNSALSLPPQPADYVLTIKGVMGYAEVKGFEDADRLPVSRFERGQLAAMVRQGAAGGNYWIFCYLHKTKQWFVTSAAWILELDKKHMLFSEMKTSRDFCLRYGGNRGIDY